MGSNSTIINYRVPPVCLVTCIPRGVRVQVCVRGRRFHPKIFIASSFKSIQLCGGSRASTVRNWAGPVVITSLLISTDGLFEMGFAWLTPQHIERGLTRTLSLHLPISPTYLHVSSPPSHNGTHINSSGYWTWDIYHPRIHLRGIFIPRVSPFFPPFYLSLPLSLCVSSPWLHSQHGMAELGSECHD